MCFDQWTARLIHIPLACSIESNYFPTHTHLIFFKDKQSINLLLFKSANRQKKGQSKNMAWEKNLSSNLLYTMYYSKCHILK